MLLLFVAANAGAQLAPADVFFNGGAQLYISNNIPAALERVETGLKTYPNDEKLKKLKQLLKQQQQQQQNQQKQDQQKKSDEQKNQQQNQQKDSLQQKPDQENQNQADQQKNEEQKASAQKKDGEKPDAEGQPVKPGEMTPAEAKRLLDAQKGDEQFLQIKPEGKPETPNRPVKDW